MLCSGSKEKKTMSLTADLGTFLYFKVFQKMEWVGLVASIFCNEKC